MKNQTHLNKVILAAVCAGSLISATTFAANPRHAQREQGTIESIDANLGQLTVKNAHSNNAQIFTWNQDTQFLERPHPGGKAKTIAPSDLKEGERVSIQFDKEGDHLVAKKIVATPARHAAAKATQRTNG